MKRLILCLSLSAMTIFLSAAGINYNGTNLTENTEFTRTQCGTMYKNTMSETSGMAASRQTKGYLWAHGDENTGSNRKIVAVHPSGTLAMTVNITTTGSDRDDWEDICTGVYGGKKYIFIGAFGDNDLKFKDEYYIYFFEEPAITSGTIAVNANYIRFGYPDNAAHNTETLMYDNVEQTFYIADKVKDGICHLYSLPFRTDYGTNLQRLTEVCALGNGDKFDLCTGGDISPDGKWIAIKNKKYLLLWERQGSESLSNTAQRLPQQVAAYQEETQGETIAWLNDSTFFTTSDDKNDVPIYQYDRWGGTVIPDPDPQPVDSSLKAINEVILSNHYYAFINSGETIIRGWYLAGESVPTIDSCNVSAGATWAQSGSTLTVTALNGSTAVYTLDIQPVTPCAFTPEEIVFDGSESSWVKGAYGWDDTKKWRFSKTDTDYSREIAGKTHVEFFLPACDTVVLKSMDSKERDVRIYVNGVQLGGKTKLLTTGNSLVVKQSSAFMLSVCSAQDSGDGGVKALCMARVSTAIETAEKEQNTTRKFIRNGVLYIERNGQTYTITGIPANR
ncbi:MAG: hypothetical protein II928_02825 [Paludibacteraceae bacterium]|nr:hypothetical protein [Paludibacteraceae bacterium]